MHLESLVTAWEVMGKKNIQKKNLFLLNALISFEVHSLAFYVILTNTNHVQHLHQYVIQAYVNGVLKHSLIILAMMLKTGKFMMQQNLLKSIKEDQLRY